MLHGLAAPLPPRPWGGGAGGEGADFVDSRTDRSPSPLTPLPPGARGERGRAASCPAAGRSVEYRWGDYSRRAPVANQPLPLGGAGITPAPTPVHGSSRNPYPPAQGLRPLCGEE